MNLLKEFEYYLEHQDELLEKYNGKVIVIKGCVVLGAYDTELEAIEDTTQSHELGGFLVQRCSPGDGAYTEMFRSRVKFD